MPDLVVVAPPNTCVASLGAVLDAHALLGALYESNRALSDYSRMATRMRLLTRNGEPVTLAGGRALAADGALVAGLEAQLVYLPAFETPRPDEMDSAADEDVTLSAWLRARRAGGAVIAAAGPSIWTLAVAGLLGETRVCVEPRLLPAFRRAFPRLEVDAVQPMSASGPVMTCGALAFEREFVARVFGQAVSSGVGDWLRMCWGGVGETALPTPTDPLISQAQLWIRERFTDNFRITTSPRSCQLVTRPSSGAFAGRQA